MTTSGEVNRALNKYISRIERANREIEDVLKTIRELEAEIEAYDNDPELQITGPIKGTIRKSKKRVEDLRKNVKKLDKELADTNRKYYQLSR